MAKKFVRKIVSIDAKNESLLSSEIGDIVIDKPTGTAFINVGEAYAAITGGDSGLADTVADLLTRVEALENGTDNILIESFELDPASLTMAVGDEDEVTITNIVPSDATNQQVAIVTEDEDIATAILNGNVIEVTARGAGTTNIVVTAIDGSDVSETLPVTVE